MHMAAKEYFQFKKLLKDKGFFTTAPRKHIFDVLQIHPALTLKGLIGLSRQYDTATVYRTVDLFEKLGIIKRIRLGWHTKIELSDIFQHHHHHLTCSSCGRVVILKEDATVEKLINQLALTKKFKATDHELEIRGICGPCQTTK